jgi:predicted negative regulator of RcsB-dependent stress response
MVRSPRRITRKEIRRPDPFITLTRRLFDLFTAHKAIFLSGTAVVAAILLALWGWELYTDRQNRLAAQQFSLALSLYHNSQYREALDALQKLDIYRSSRYRPFGLLYQAHTYMALNDSPKADQAVQEFLRTETRDFFLRQLALLTLAHNQERTGRCKEAIETYAQAEALQAPFKEEALLGKARCSGQLQNFTEALNAYRQFTINYPTSERAKEAALLAQQMEVKASASGGK